jgi:hypothetical protein
MLINLHLSVKAEHVLMLSFLGESLSLFGENAPTHPLYVALKDNNLLRLVSPSLCASKRHRFSSYALCPPESGTKAGVQD